MISGSVRCVRQALEDTGHPEVQIMPHLIFDSRLYDAYRQTMDASPASGDRRVFQIDPAQPEIALRASLGFVDEGADMLLLEPALFCADVLTALKRACIQRGDLRGQFQPLPRGHRIRAYRHRAAAVQLSQQRPLG